MSKLVAFAAIQGGYNVVSEVEGDLRNALAAYNADTKVEFPNTGYYLPVIYSFTGRKMETLADLKSILDYSKTLLPNRPADNVWLPYLGNTLDAGVAALFAVIHFRPIEFPGLFMFGLIVGVAAKLTGRLGMSIMAHIGFNFTGLMLVL